MPEPTLRGGRGRGWGLTNALPGHRSAVSASRSPSGGARPGGGMVLCARWARRGAAPVARPARPAAPGSSPSGYTRAPGMARSPGAALPGRRRAALPGLRRCALSRARPGRSGAGARAQRPVSSPAAPHLAGVAWPPPPPPPRLLRPRARPIPIAPPPLPAPAAGRPSSQRASERGSRGASERKRGGGRAGEGGAGRPGEGPPPEPGSWRPPRDRRWDVPLLGVLGGGRLAAEAWGDLRGWSRRGGQGPLEG